MQRLTCPLCVLLLSLILPTTIAPDRYIASLSDPSTESMLSWLRYLEQVISGAWGDHVVVAALANMFNVTINVVHARHGMCTVATTTPMDSEPTCELNLCNIILLA